MKHKTYRQHSLNPSLADGFTNPSGPFRRKTATALAIAAFLSGSLLATSLHGQSATRSLPANYTAGGSIEVTIQANPGSADFWGMEEFVPNGWTVTNIRINGESASSAQAAFVPANHQVNFGPFFDSNARTFAYTATAPSDASGTATFGGGGQANISGNTGSATIGGDTTVAAEAPADPVPVITVHPQSQEVDLGASVTFSVTVESDTDVTYQWRRNGADIDGATGATLTIDSAAEADAGDYTVAVTNEHGTTISNVATLEVTIPPLLPVAIDVTLDPGDVLLSGSKIFNLAATLDYSVDIGGETNNVDITVDHNHRGRLTGSGQVNGQDAEVHGTVRRFGSASDPLHRVNLTVRVPETGIALDHTLDIDASGNLTGNVRRRGSADSQSVSIALPGEIDGSWSLDIETGADGNGTATLNLVNQQIAYNVKAGQSAAHNNRKILTLSPSTANGGGSLRVDLDQNNEVVLVMGRAKGQSINAR